MNIQPIQTYYNGYKFRSRLEARWAVFFDALGLQWEYEKEGFQLPTACYLPDFWIETVHMWAEIKPQDGFEIRQTRLVCELAEVTGRQVLMLEGVPRNEPYKGIDKYGFAWMYCLTNHKDYPQKEHRFFCEPAGYERLWQDTEKAVIAAKSARFEHRVVPRFSGEEDYNR